MGLSIQAAALGPLERISIVLATFNGERFLGEQLESLRHQTRLPDELVVVDDGSRDSTVAILEEFAGTAPFPVKLLLRSEHLGTWQTFEEGLRAATGDIIVICDQDDRWLPEKIAVVADRMAARPEAQMAFSDARLIDAEGRSIGESRWRVAGFPPRHAQAVSVDPFGEIFCRQAVSGCTMAVRATLLPALLPFPLDIHPGFPVMMYDRWIALTAAAAGPVITAPEPLIEYRIHAGQQIGIPALAVRRLAPVSALLAAQFLHGRAEITRRMEYHIAHLVEIQQRLDAAGIAGPGAAARLLSAERHLRFRASLAPRRRARVGPVLAELRRDDTYRRFSLGAVSALADVAR